MFQGKFTFYSCLLETLIIYSDQRVVFFSLNKFIIWTKYLVIFTLCDKDYHYDKFSPSYAAYINTN